MEVIKLNHQQWLERYNTPTSSLFNTPDFINVISTTYQKSLTWYVVLDKNELLFSVPIYFKNRNAELITHFFYQAILINTQFSEQQFSTSWRILIQQLKNDFDAIDFKFAPYVEDVSPLLLGGFEQVTRKTSVIDLQNFPNYSENVIRSLKKAAKHSLALNVYEYNEEIIAEQVLDMMKYGLAKKHALYFKDWFKQCAQQSSAIVFELIENDVRIGSSLYLYDKSSAYLIATMGGNVESGGQAYLYDQAFVHFKVMELKEVDLLGANIPSVALYKSKLGAELRSYQILSYRKYKISSKILAYLKIIAKKMLKSIRIINK